VSTYCYVDTILHGATLEIKMGSPDAYETVALGEAQGLRCVLNVHAESKLAANHEAGVTWSRVAFARAFSA
jgi:hypothetical protein